MYNQRQPEQDPRAVRRADLTKGRDDMNIVCLDMEGVLVPEIWIAFSEASGLSLIHI